LKRSVALLAAVVLLAACSGSDAETTTGPVSTTTTPTGGDNLAAAAAEQFDTTGDDLVAVMQAWREMFKYFGEHPTGTVDEILDQLYTPTSDRREAVRTGFAELVDNDWHMIDPGTVLWGVKILENNGNTATVWEAIERGAATDGLQIIGDSEGNPVKTFPGYGLRIREVHLVRDNADARWLVDAVPLFDTSVEQEDLELLDFDWIRTEG
jgi:hypothetical protein